MSSTFDSAEINSAALQFALAKHDSAAVSLSALTCHACQPNVFIAGKAVQANLLALPLTRRAMVGAVRYRSIITSEHRPYPSRPQKVVAVLQGLEEKAWLRLCVPSIF